MHIDMIRVKRNAYFIQFLLRATERQRKFLLKTASKDQVLAVTEIIINLIQGHFNLSSTQRTSLAKYKRGLRKVGRQGGISWTRRRALLRQNTTGVINAIRIIHKHLKL